MICKIFILATFYFASSNIVTSAPNIEGFLLKTHSFLQQSLCLQLGPIFCKPHIRHMLTNEDHFPEKRKQCLKTCPESLRSLRSDAAVFLFCAITMERGEFDV